MLPVAKACVPLDFCRQYIYNISVMSKESSESRRGVASGYFANLEATGPLAILPDGTQRGGAVAAHQSHKLKVASSSLAPATTTVETSTRRRMRLLRTANALASKANSVPQPNSSRGHNTGDELLARRRARLLRFEHDSVLASSRKHNDGDKRQRRRSRILRLSTPEGSRFESGRCRAVQRSSMVEHQAYTNRERSFPVVRKMGKTSDSGVEYGYFAKAVFGSNPNVRREAERSSTGKSTPVVDSSLSHESVQEVRRE